MTSPITVYASGGPSTCGYIYDFADAFRTKQELRLLGDFVGTLPKHVSQNQYLSLPLALSYDEVHFGVSRGMFRVVRDTPEDYYDTDDTVVHQFFARRKELVEEQAQSALETQMRERMKRTGMKRKREDLEDKEEETVGKRRKVGWWGWVGETVWGLMERMRMKNDKEEQRKEEERKKVEEEEKKREVLREKVLKQSRQTALVVTETGCRNNERSRHEGMNTVLARPRGMSEQKLRSRAKVFAELWDRGYYLSCGAKFGADFLAYAGHPVLFHAALAVVVVEAEQDIDMLEIVAMGRLGGSTKKRMVYAYVDEDQVRFIGVQWEETLP